MKTNVETKRRETLANGLRGRIRRNERRLAIQGKRAFAYMGSVA